MNCSECHKPIKPGVKFCPYCGQKTEKPVVDSVPPQGPINHVYKRTNKLPRIIYDRKFLIITTSIFVAVILTILIMLLADKKGPPENTSTIKKTEQAVVTQKQEEPKKEKNTKTTIQKNQPKEKQPTVSKKKLRGKYPQASQKVLKDSELLDFNAWEMKIMRNEIFARYGYVFKSDAMKNYFGQQSWYTSLKKLDYNDDGSSYLTDIELANIKTLLRLEKRKKDLGLDRFRMTSKTYSEKEDLNQAVFTEFGNEYRMADWSDLLLMHNVIEELVRDMNMDSGGKRSVLITYYQKQFYSSNRHYFAAYHNHKKPPNFMAHKNIDNYYISLGSWHGLNYYILCIRK